MQTKVRKMRIITITENTVSGGELMGQWGLSILVESEESSVLLDARVQE